ncbi:hypothetical protein PHYBOEH_009450 [Phytophthora boehmeriae]|uniref:Polycystin cation channel PKD1/PKD2 domain-containing protein n=1 Tax=Phytophthora boehmeriae TaxID=109152 RepID=A0A8T1XEV8_9STRA|nr:hypothetical protein PHYBOEH_009450 [Phytophthora boehmeriae]
MRRLLRTLWKICAIGGSVPVFAAVWAVIEYQLNSDMFRSNLLKLADKSLEDDATVLNALVPVVDLLNSMTAWTYALALAGAILSIQLGLYTLFQLDFHPRLSIFTRTMSSALRQFVAFFVVWIIAFMIFVCVGSILFGSDVEEFSTRLLTAQACINMLFGTFDYSSIKKLQFAFIFYWCFMIVVNLVLINMTLAIVLDAYGVVREESYKGKTSLMLNGRIKGFCLDKFYSKDPARCAAASAEPVIANRLVSQVFKRISADIRKLPSEFVVLRNKVNPALLLHVLEAKLELDHQTDEQRLSSPTKLTAGLVKEMFPKANLSDEQLRNTFKYLHDGVAINKCAIKQAQRKDPDRERHMITSIQSCSADTTGSDIFSDRRSPRLAMLEQKMEHLLRDVLAVQATIRDVGLREVQ